ncbi:hypothetical protein PFISCL1PPCAC_17786, partial [Pristionchus fissidentatus]
PSVARAPTNIYATSSSIRSPCGHVICDHCIKFLVDNGYTDRRMTEQQDRMIARRIKQFALLGTQKNLQHVITPP